MRDETPAPVFGRRDIGLPTLLFAFLGAAVIWSLHFGAVYLGVALLCTTGRAQMVPPVIYATTAVAALAALASGVVAYRQWKRLREGPEPLDRASVAVGGRTTALLLMGMMSAALFTLFIILEGLAPLFVPACSVIQP